MWSTSMGIKVTPSSLDYCEGLQIRKLALQFWSLPPKKCSKISYFLLTTGVLFVKCIVHKYLFL